MKIGYARVSTEDQRLDMQMDALKKAGCHKIFKDAGISALAKDRPGYLAAIDALKNGDTLVVWALDRAFRSTIHAVTELNRFAKMDVEFKCLTQPIDTTTPEGRFLYRQLASFAELEHDLISKRTKDGMAAAKQRGKHIGRPRTACL